MDKAALRRKLQARRSSLSLAEVKKINREIISHFLAVIEGGAIMSIHTYLPIAESNEIDTRPLIKLARQMNPDVKIASWDSTNINAKAVWLDGKLQPTKLVPPKFQYGLIVVPLLAFDCHGHRLGYGSGFYDSFLAEQEHALTIGLCYEFGHLERLPSEPHDIPINLVVTEEKIYKA